MKKIAGLLSFKEYMYMLICVFLIVGQVFFEIKIPNVMGELTDLVYSGKADISEEIKYGIIMFAYAGLSLVFSFLVAYLVAKVGAALDRRVRRQTFTKIIDFSLKEVGDFGTSSLIARCTTDIYQIQNFFVNGFQPLIKSPIMIIWVTAQISGANVYYRSATITAVAILVAVLSAIAILVLPIVNKAQYAKDELIRIDREHLDGIRVVHAYNGYEKQKERFEEANKRITDLLLRYDKSSALFAPFSNMVMYSLTVIIYIMGAYIVADSAKSLRSSVSNEMIVFVSMLSMLISSCIYLIIIMVLLPNASVSLKRIAQVLNKKTMIMDPEEAFAKDPAICGTLEFRNVSFMYPGSREYAIRDISFRMEKGETVAIVGGTGSGKTTLLNLIPRLYEATEGEILVDGVDIKKMKLKDLRNIFGYVPQKSFLFSGTIVSNIDFGDNGKLKKTIEEIVKASKLGKADEFIRAKEGGYNAHVEEGGSNFSGGQRQRLTISRAICRDPEIFLFDDSFSALDYKTDKIVREGLKETLSGASVLMVAQRISTIRSADRIIVLDNGRMVGMGTHDELMTSCNVYREIVLSQTDTEATG